jgi:hypothetical protein
MHQQYVFDTGGPAACTVGVAFEAKPTSAKVSGARRYFEFLNKEEANNGMILLLRRLLAKTGYG